MRGRQLRVSGKAGRRARGVGYERTDSATGGKAAMHLHRRWCREGQRQGGAGRIAGRLERDATVMAQVVLRLAVQFVQVVREAVRPHALLAQQQGGRQQGKSEQAANEPAQRKSRAPARRSKRTGTRDRICRRVGAGIHEKQYTRAQKCYSGSWNKPGCRFVYCPTGRSR